MKLYIEKKKNNYLKVILTDDRNRAIRFDGIETDCEGPRAALALRGLIDFLKEKSPHLLPRLEEAVPEGLLNFRGERNF